MTVTSKNYKAALFSLFLMGVAYAADEPVANQDDLPVIFGEKSTDSRSVFYKAERDCGGQLGVVVLSAPHSAQFSPNYTQVESCAEAHKAFFEALTHFIIHCTDRSEASDKNKDVNEKVKSILDVSQLQRSRNSRERLGGFLQFVYQDYPADMTKILDFLERKRTFYCKKKQENTELWKELDYQGVWVTDKKVDFVYKSNCDNYAIEEEQNEMQEGFLLMTGSLYVNGQIMVIFRQEADRRKARDAVCKLFKEFSGDEIEPIYAIVDVDSVRADMAARKASRSPKSEKINLNKDGGDLNSDDEYVEI